MLRNNVLLFGSGGHLTQTKLIPAIKHNNMSYIPLSRQILTKMITVLCIMTTIAKNSILNLKNVVWPNKKYNIKIS